MAAPLASPGVNGLPPPSPTALSPTIDPDVLVQHLTRVLEFTLSASPEELAAPGSLLSPSREKETKQRCERFALESNLSLYIQKELASGSHLYNSSKELNGDSPLRYNFTITFELYSSPNSVAWTVLSKHSSQPIDFNIRLDSQIYINTLPGALVTSTNKASASTANVSSYEVLYSLVNAIVSPYFDASTKTQELQSAGHGKQAESRAVLPSTRRKLEELKQGLQSLQQNVEIPPLVLTLPPLIQDVLDEAERKHHSPAEVQIDPALREDQTFLSNVQTTVNGWIKSIQTLTKQDRDPSRGTASQEIKFWLDMETRLENVEAQLASDGVMLALNLLKSAKRFQATLGFAADTGLKDRMEEVKKYNLLMRDFPLDDLTSATSLAKVRESIEQIFGHLNKKLRVCPYPIRRALPFVSAISADLDTRLHMLLQGRTLMNLDFAQFDVYLNETEDIWRTWDDCVKEFTNVAREVTRRRNEKFIPIKIQSNHEETQKRLRYVHTFRKNHEQLQKTIISVLGSVGQGLETANGTSNDAVIVAEIGDIDAVDEVSQAYAALKDVDVLDVTPEGNNIWTAAEETYNERTSRVENSIIARLRDRLAVAKNANEMFRVFSKFNALFVRPKIRGAISEYQATLIQNVNNDVDALHDRFKRQYGHSQAHAMAQLRDIPPVSGAIIWARQIEKQLDGYMKKMGDILGTEWHLHAEGQKFDTESKMFRKKLDTKPVFDSWLQEVNRRNLSISGRLFTIHRNRAAGNVLEISVNFDAQIIALFKEVRNLIWLNYQVPHAISNISKDAKRVYPYAVSLMESVRTYAQTAKVIEDMGPVSILLHQFRNDAQGYIRKGLPLQWDSFIHAYDIHIRGPSVAVDRTGGHRGNESSSHVKFVREFATAVSTLQSKTTTLVTIHAAVEKATNDLETCSYRPEAFKANLDIIQRAVDQLNLESYVNLDYWVGQMNARIESILVERLRRAILQWLFAFENAETDTQHVTSSKAVSNEDSPEESPRLTSVVHEITLRNQLIYLDPPLEYSRASWLEQLHVWLAVVCTLEKVKASRYEMRLEVAAIDNVARFSDLPSLCAESLMQLYNAVEGKIAVISEYMDKWLQFQSLWDLQSDHVYSALGEDLANWLMVLQEIRKSRSTFDTTETSKTFGYVTIDYEQVQNKVNQKYDQWQHDILSKFAGRLQVRMTEVFVEIEKARNDLEKQSLDSSTTAQAVAFITIVQQCKRKVKAWAPEVELFQQGEKILKRQRYQLPSDWLYIEQIDHAWTALNEVLERKSKIVNDQSDALRAKIAAEDQVVNGKIADIIQQWNAEKPVSGAIAPDEASRTLQEFDTAMNILQTEAQSVAKAKEALDLPASAETSLASVLEEVQDFKSVWSNLSTIWNSLNDLRETLWTSTQPRKLRESLNKLIEMTKQMPSRMRQYAAFEHVQNVLRGHLKSIPILQQLREECMRERHWIKIFKTLNTSKRYSQLSLTLGDVWDLQPVANQTTLTEIIQQAQQEKGLEEYLRQVRDTWQDYALDLVNYSNKCRLIRGWDDLFAKCSEHLNSLQAMRNSAFYKEFEEEASSWEEKLNRVHVLFDVWIDVQRQWVYLEGVFTGNADIKHLLPIESNRFANINNEFLIVMKKVARSPMVLEVLAISGVQKSLERLAELLNKIQKALGEYLERERMAFPRFYFVGDEDLLEIIGNSNDSARIAKHLKKMFAGINGLLNDEEGTIIGFTSKEGEEVMLRNEVSLIKIPKVNEWLTALEGSMKLTLAELLADATQDFLLLMAEDTLDSATFDEFVAKYPAQVVVLATQVSWTSTVETSLVNGGGSLSELYDKQVNLLRQLASAVLGTLEPIRRKKCEHLITECVHQRDTIGKLRDAKVESPNHHLWLSQMRYVYRAEGDHLHRLSIKMANATLAYGWEYLGVPERLVRTPLTDRCFLTLTQALEQRLGGSPYGPAGTGKTESVKALGLQLGRFTLVFCCDDTFDFQAMGRIFLGICQVGAWGCFDEFNRLEERILSAVSQQVQNIQVGLKKGAIDPKTEIELVGRNLKVNSSTGIFITMNPGYAGRSNLPDNLKKLFRSVAMSKPDKELIAEVMLYSQGFSMAKDLSRQVVPFFDQCGARLSKQSHYDFGLRALKSVLVSSGGLKRARLALQSDEMAAEEVLEPQIIVQSLRETMAPKLIRTDAEIMREIETAAFPGVEYIPAPLTELKAAIHEVAKKRQMVVSDAWMTKILQLYQIQGLHHGVMMVGSSGAGKSTAWKTLLQALQDVEGVEGVCHVIDPKVMCKEDLYGSLDNTTREWTDGLFTSILRKIVDNLRGEDTKRHWIIFDGDVDPEWVENLNSVLDDNKLLTLPNGERLNLPPNVRIMFEVETLRYATLATVSRCGMVWFSDDTVSIDMIVSNYIQGLRETPFDDIEDESVAPGQLSELLLAMQNKIANYLEVRLTQDGLIEKALEYARDFQHIMEYTDIRVLNTLFSLLNKVCRNIIEYNISHSDFLLEDEQIELYLSKKLLLALVWSLTGDGPLGQRKLFGDRIAGLTTVDLPMLNESTSLIDFDVILPRGEWALWQSQVPNIEVNTHSVTQTDVVIPTLDTVRHEDVLYSWLAEHKPLLLCGPPGSGKTMTLFSALRKLPNMEVVGLNFSSATTPDLLIKTFEQYCEYKKTLNGTILSPTQIGKWLVIFCDEINLPAPDNYGTQRAISFLRQLVEQNGFWRTSDKTWVTLDRIQFVGACNPPTDAGRTPMGLRFLRHSPLIMVDYPGEASLLQIYGTFNTAVLKMIPSLRGYADPLTKAMVQLYAESQIRFTPDIQPHYVYSPRELTRWVRGIYEAIRPLENLSVEGLVRIWAHEALRLFQDRLIADDERKWTEESVSRVAMSHFPTIDEQQALGGPILFSNWLSKDYIPVEREQLREFVKARLKTFCEEELDVPLILFNDVLEHVLRIDRVFRQPQGHLILIGVSGSGKTTLSRFVAWMNGLKVYQIKVHGKYSGEDFDEDLRNVLRRCGTKGEKICFIMDEANVLDSGFLERMNTLLANAEVPGLFEGDEYQSLMTACREGAQRENLLLDSQEELYKWFTQQIVKNLHVVFTMNPPEEGLSSKAATSPALFNRCVLNWFGDWSDQALFQVGSELTQSVDLGRANFNAPDSLPVAYRDLHMPPSHREAVVNAMVHVHFSLHRFNAKLQRQQNRTMFLTPRHFLDFVAQYVKLYNEKREDLEEQQRHLNVGLEKLRETFDKVRDLRSSLSKKQAQLEAKQTEAEVKLRAMLENQQQAETSKKSSLELQQHLERQDAIVAERKKVVEADLARAEPAVAEAQKSVSNIKRQHLTEVRSMQNPPTGVKLALEAVCTLLGHKVPTWKDVLAIVKRDDFIGSIVNYDNEAQMTERHRVKMRNEYLSKDEFTFERVNRASKACGPLVQWVIAQVEYSEILDSVGPLREEVVQLENQALDTRATAQVTQRKLEELEVKIEEYKKEYASLVSQTESLKAEMSHVEAKVERSMRLLDSLASERERWEAGSKSFETQIDTIVGDVLIAAAFIAYAGYYDQQYRKAMMDDWSQHLSMAGIKYKTTNPIAEYLSTADERLNWQRNSLPVDDLCTENAIILKRFNRYPLIIDPSGRVAEFLQNESKDRRLVVTSFLDDSFTKQLESALRFGNSILIQDAEHLDPILNHVLNKEYQRTGGRILIQLGKQEIDFSPGFRVFLSTRDPSAAFPPDICSRTTFVNFTVTQSSLQTQTLNEVLKSERPDVDERRSDLIKSQGEYSAQLRGLEKRLLQALNESQGNILDDDKVIQTLETLKKQAAEITTKVREAEGVMGEVEKITLEYSVIARSCAAVFAVLEEIHHLNHFYQFSLQYFTDIFHTVLQRVKQTGQQSSANKRIEDITNQLFIDTYQRTSLALVQKDRVTLAMLLAQAAPAKMDKSLIDRILDEDLEAVDVSTQYDRKDEVMSRVAKLPMFKDVVQNASTADWDRFVGEELAENYAPPLWSSEAPELNQSLLSIILVKAFRVDRFIPAVERFVTKVFGKGLLDSSGDLASIVREVNSTTPIALSSSPGFDASYKVDNLVDKSHATCTNIALGSTEGAASADKAISNAAAQGSWVLVKNVHLDPLWLQNLTKRIDSLKPHHDFRLFLSMETSPKIPVNLLRASRILMYEQPAGIRANMKDSLSSLATRATQQPVERARVYLLLCFLHAVIQERLRYAPQLGWKGFWEFNDSDYECCAFIIDTWVDIAAQGRTNVAPKNIPWEMLRLLITEMYGGKIDNESDFQQLRSLVDQVVTSAAFEDNFKLVQPSEGDSDGLELPSSTGWKDFMSWVNALPEREPPTYLGLPANAEKLLLVGQAKEMTSNLRMVCELLDEGEQVMAEAEA